MSGMVIFFFSSQTFFLTLILTFRVHFMQISKFNALLFFVCLVLNTVKLEYNRAKLVDVNTGRGLLQ